MEYERLISILWGVIVLLCGALGWFLISFFKDVKASKQHIWKAINDNKSYFDQYCGELDDLYAKLVIDFEKCKINGCKERERLFEKYKEMYDTRYATRDELTKFKSWFDTDFMRRFIHIEDKVK